MSLLKRKNVNEDNEVVEKLEPVKVHTRPKTPRNYERVRDVVDFYNVIGA